MTINCKHYAEGRCLGIYKSVTDLRVALKDLPHCLHDVGQTREGMPANLCGVAEILDAGISRRAIPLESAPAYA